ncbi:TIM barrel protein [Lichenihabitans sp. Uapishka_5]|uniref:hydroxypyruvate isomerase family protein n=1 Tax=Lichenihabitans sp. Uapishka_5 TaxID=3037302 RepID=UPI0029E81342|nr:TIM barrel protein [Lichenihabitans sp. Uapishka_5]MDX7952622.1 TIM barrel protein [Lichenihabitans sp. Uapishka_5]
MARFSANLGFLWAGQPLLDGIAAAARAGFKAIELHWPYDTPAGAVRDACARHGLTLLGVNTVRGDVAAGENGLGALPGREAEFQAAVDQSLAFCRYAGGSAIHCMAGRVPPEARTAARETFLDNLRRASDKAAAADIMLLLEPLNSADAPNYFYSTADEGAAIVQALGRPNVRLMFDCYHVGRVGNDVIATMARLWPTIGHIQIAAVPGRAEPDGGTLDYRPVLAAVDRLGYAGWVGAEYKPVGDTDAGLGWVEALGAHR